MTEFEQIYSAYFSEVYLYLLSLCRDEALAEELTGETFFRALQGLSGFKGDSSVGTWLCSIAKNCYLNDRKKNRRTQSTPPEELEELLPGEDLEGRLTKRDEALTIQRLLHQLPEPYKEVFLWRVFGELSFRQIGELFQKTENWACVTYHRAKKMIRERMESGKDDQNEK